LLDTTDPLVALSTALLAIPAAGNLLLFRSLDLKNDQDDLVGQCQPKACSSDTAVVLQPTSVSLLFGGEWRFSGADSAINQSGFTSSYDSGTTLFDTYSSVHRSIGLDIEYSSVENSAQLVFDLGSVVTINGFALWNEDSGTHLARVAVSSL